MRWWTPKPKPAPALKPVASVEKPTQNPSAVEHSAPTAPAGTVPNAQPAPAVFRPVPPGAPLNVPGPNGPMILTQGNRNSFLDPVDWPLQQAGDMLRFEVRQGDPRYKGESPTREGSELLTGFVFPPGKRFKASFVVRHLFGTPTNEDGVFQLHGVVGVPQFVLAIRPGLYLEATTRFGVRSTDQIPWRTLPGRIPLPAAVEIEWETGPRGFYRVTGGGVTMEDAGPTGFSAEPEGPRIQFGPYIASRPEPIGVEIEGFRVEAG